MTKKFVIEDGCCYWVGEDRIYRALEEPEYTAEIERLRAALQRIHGIVHEPLQHKNRETQMGNICDITTEALRLAVGVR